MGSKFRAKNMVVIVIAAVACASLVSSSVTEKNEKTLKNEDNSSQSFEDKIVSSDLNLFSKSNGTTVSTTRQDKKIMYRLIGGHVKIYPTKVNGATNDGEKNRRIENLQSLNWDDGLMMSSAGNGKEKEKEKEKTSSTRRDDDDEGKKSLSQQVKEGKYGLIQNEIYPTPPKRPGIISYTGNPEVPKDTAKNLGGLDEEEIWLAENHLLVLRGGKFPEHGRKPEYNREKWPPIDDYKAPERQVKIPPRPEVPPPFPVQLTEGGPVQIIRANGSISIVNDTADYDEYSNYSEGFLPGEAPFYPFPSNSSDSSDYLGNNSYLPSSGTLGPFYPALPPGAVFLPPPNNQTDYEDDDQSIYYPPPYSFYYQKENSSAVPPGPLVPGIILPPPPNFFASLDEKKSHTKTKYEKQTTTTTEDPEETSTYTPPLTTSSPPPPPPRRKTIAKPSYNKIRLPTTTPTVTTYVTRTKPSTTRVQSQTQKTILKTKAKNYTTLYPNTVTSIPITVPPYVETTTSPPEKPTTISSHYFDVQTEIENHLIDLGEPQGGRWSAIVSSTPVPLLAYYPTTSTSSERTRSVDEISPIHLKANIPPQSKNQASYYYYEETSGEETVATTTPTPQVYFETSTEAPSYYDVEPISNHQRQPKRQYYSVEMIPSEQTSSDYDVKLSSPIKNPSSYNINKFSEQDALRAPIKYNLERLRGQSQESPSQRYYQPISLSHSGNVKPYYTTQRPRFYYQTPQNQNYDYRDEQELKSNPVYQYSYESNDYANQRHQQNYRGQEIREEEGPQVFNNYRQTPQNPTGQFYDYETRLPIEKLQQKSPRVPYLENRPSYSTVTVRPLANTTPNPEHAYYTKQDEQLLDDVTKQYFTIFGKKLSENVLQSTTPLYRLPSTTTESPINHNVNTYIPNQLNGKIEAVQHLQRLKPPKVKVHYGDQTQRPYSLEGDTLVNYKNPLPPINPDAEFITVNKPVVQNQRQRRPEYRPEQITQFGNRPHVANYLGASNPRETYPRRYPTAPISLANDIAVNYRDPRPPINPDAEFINPVQGQGNQPNRGSGSYFAYKLPGNGGHFYFLTPQAISSQREENIQSEYYYQKPIGSRIIRRRRGPAEG